MLYGSRVLADDDKPRTVFSWGSSQFGQLGLGGEDGCAAGNPNPTASDYLARHNVLSVAAGGESSAVVTSNGDVFTFGAGGSSRLGHGAALDTPNQAVPQLVEGLRGEPVTSLSVGEYHMVALTAKGEVFTWGKDRSPQLGHANAQRGRPNLVSLPNGARATHVAAGRQQTCAVSEQGELFSWGLGFEGALGHGTKQNEARPKLVDALHGHKVVDVSCGREFTLALTDAGELFSWGANDYGQLGQGHTVRYQRSPAKLASMRKRVVAIATGEFHAAALADDGTVYTWGQGKEGQLGHNGRDSVSLPRLVEELRGKGVKLLSCGGGHTAAVDEKEQLWLFGRGRSGQLGRGDQLESIAAYRSTPTLVEALTQQKVVDVSLGREHTLAVATPR